MQLSASTALIAVGGTALATAYLSGNYFGFVTVFKSGTITDSGWGSDTPGQGYLDLVSATPGRVYPSKWSLVPPGGSETGFTLDDLQVATAILFNLPPASVALGTTASMPDTSKTIWQQGYNPGPLGESAAYLFAGMIGLGLAAKYLNYDRTFRLF